MSDTATNEAPAHRSYSQVSQLRRCGWGYKLERIDKYPSRPGAAGVAGSAIHLGTEYVDENLALLGGDELALSATVVALDAFDAEVAKLSQKFQVDTWKAYGRPVQDVHWFRDRGIGYAIEAYVDWRLTYPTLVVAQLCDVNTGELVKGVEVPFEITVGTTPVRGFIDRVFEDGNGTPIILDIKSGAKPKSDEQLGIYRYALLKQYGYDATYGTYLYNLKNGQPKVTEMKDLSLWSAERLTVLYDTASQIIDKGLFVPNPGDACFICHVSESCDYYRASFV